MAITLERDKYIFAKSTENVSRWVVLTNSTIFHIGPVGTAIFDLGATHLFCTFPDYLGEMAGVMKISRIIVGICGFFSIPHFDDRFWCSGVGGPGDVFSKTGTRMARRTGAGELPGAFCQSVRPGKWCDPMDFAIGIMGREPCIVYGGICGQTVCYSQAAKEVNYED